jgi:hypothetical protein
VTMLNTQTATASRPASELQRGDVIRYRYYYASRDTRYRVEMVRVFASGTTRVEIVNDDLQGDAREESRTQRSYDPDDQVTVEVAS